MNVIDRVPENMKPLVNKVIHGDSAKLLKMYPDNSIDMHIVSPPY